MSDQHLPAPLVLLVLLELEPLDNRLLDPQQGTP
jgi:hypothetical protein